MNIELSPEIRKWVSLGLLLVFIFSIWGFILKPIINLTGQALDQLYDARFELARAKKISEEIVNVPKNDIQTEIAVLRHLLIWGDINSGKESTMQEIVDQIIRSTHFNLESMRIAKTSQQGSIMRVSIELKGDGEESSIMEMITEIERHTPLIVIDQLTLRTLNIGTSNSQGTIVSKLAAEFRLSGFGGDLAGLESSTR
ncbi:GspMb/PilO family protein [Methylomonas sp. UP202]|uniref:GspMb/PilO family protein n=1 Tax=Methylomonas sp. UP202 TaxID=3040943 RepID=UPI002478DFE2|nr:GspMb/PilO family protein [Methylomonas sp. UP202]WGS88631.1 GspMb/PilO family protein [Methylomonas sp. UP202]